MNLKWLKQHALTVGFVAVFVDRARGVDLAATGRRVETRRTSMPPCRNNSRNSTI
jgi:hypothetical protein